MTACGGSTGPGEEDIAATQQADEAWNSLTSNSLTSNSLTSNSLTSNSLTSNSLTSNSLTSNSLTSQSLSNDPAAREVLKYIIGCALPADTTINLQLGNTLYSFAGQLGLAPSWGTEGGSCDADCRGWVSGCVLSRVNYDGTPVHLSLRGAAGGLASAADEQAAFPNREATYYGNIFANPQVRYACMSPGSTLISRVCGSSITNCVMTVLGDCTDFCDAATSASAGSYFPNCRSDRNDPSTTFPGSVTVFRE